MSARSNVTLYPVTTLTYATAIARDWNAKGPNAAGFVTRFAVDASYSERFERHVVGGREHEELWVPAEQLGEFNAHITDPIEVIASFARRQMVLDAIAAD